MLSTRGNADPDRIVWALRDPVDYLFSSTGLRAKAQEARKKKAQRDFGRLFLRLGLITTEDTELHRVLSRD